MTLSPDDRSTVDALTARAIKEGGSLLPLVEIHVAAIRRGGERLALLGAEQVVLDGRRAAIEREVEMHEASVAALKDSIDRGDWAKYRPDEPYPKQAQ